MKHTVQFTVHSLQLIVLMCFCTSIWADKATILKSLDKHMSVKKPEYVGETPLPGLYEVIVGTKVVYMSKDGRYLMNGDLLDLQESKNLSNERRKYMRVLLFNKTGEDKMLIYTPKIVKYTITIFTDVNNLLSRRLHSHIQEFLAMGIKIRYIFYPTGGSNSASYKNAVSIWCSRDRNGTMTLAQSGAVIKKGSCQTPIEEHIALGKALAITKLPTLFLQSGEIIPSYVTPGKLKIMLKKIGVYL